MEVLGRRMAGAGTQVGVVYLQGALGSGKTTLARGWLRGLGISGPIRSPTYTLVELYESPQGSVIHLDLYRLNDPEELEFLGVRDYFGQDILCLIEWPERGAGFIPPPDLIIDLDIVGSARHIRLDAYSERGRRLRESARSVPILT
jgi:tRNA threonylcarbamoyladenosine biosynthesis protein TsaE